MKNKSRTLFAFFCFFPCKKKKILSFWWEHELFLITLLLICLMHSCTCFLFLEIYPACINRHAVSADAENLALLFFLDVTVSFFLFQNYRMFSDFLYLYYVLPSYFWPIRFFSILLLSKYEKISLKKIAIDQMLIIFQVVNNTRILLIS